jgi:hypothetical protein
MPTSFSIQNRFTVSVGDVFVVVICVPACGGTSSIATLELQLSRVGFYMILIL